MAIYTNGDKTPLNDLSDFRVTTVDTSGGGGGGGGRTGSTQEVEIPDGVLIVAVGVIVAWALGVF